MLWPVKNLKWYNLICVKNTGGFLRVRQPEGLILKLPSTDPCCHGNKLFVFKDIIGYN